MSDVIDLASARASRIPVGTRFVLEARDVGSEETFGWFAWDWFIEDLDSAQWRPDKVAIACQLRRIADRYDPPRRRLPMERRGRRR